MGYLQQDLKDFSNHLDVLLSDLLNQGLHEQDCLYVQLRVYYVQSYYQHLSESLLLSDPLNQGLHKQDYLYVQYYFSNYVQDLGELYHLILPVSVPLIQGLLRLQNLSALNYVLF